MNPLKLSKRDYKKFVKSQRMYEGVDFRKLPRKDNDGSKYITLPKDFVFYWLNRKTFTIRGLFRTNGADKVKDLIPLAWHIHDAICKVPYWDDGTPITNFKASWIYRSILRWNGIKVRAVGRFVFTFLFGGKTIKKQAGWI